VRAGIGLCDEVSCAETTILRLAEPFCQQHYVPADGRYVNKIDLAIAFNLVEIFAARITFGGAADLQQMPKLFHSPGCIVSWVFDPRSFLDLNHQAPNLLQHHLITTDSGDSN